MAKIKELQRSFRRKKLQYTFNFRVDDTETFPFHIYWLPIQGILIIRISILCSKSTYFGSKYFRAIKNLKLITSMGLKKQDNLTTDEKTGISSHGGEFSESKIEKIGISKFA